jgi:hypothetical protein
MTSKDNNSHFQLLIPATYDVKKTKRDNIISKLHSQMTLVLH